MSVAVAAVQGRPRTSLVTYAGLAFVTLATIMDEIVLTRIFSVTMWYHFAFVAISVALFGMTVGALAVYLQPRWFPEADIKRHLWLFSLFFAVSIALAFVSQLSIPFSPGWSLVSAWSVMFTCLVISVPFALSGVVVCLALTRFPARVNRLYAADLIGAALGSSLLVWLLNRVDGPSAVILVAALAAVGSLLFAIDAGSANGMLLAAAAVVLLGGFGFLNSRLAAANGEPPLRLMWVKQAREPDYRLQKWNAFSRVTVEGDPNVATAPFGWGLSPVYPLDRKVEQLGMAIDAGAATTLTRYSGDPSQIEHLKYDVSNLAHYIRHNARVMVVGVGGGRDLLSALAFNQASVTGVEMNGAILQILNGTYGDFTGHLDRNPKVTLVNDEARSYLTRSKDRYDVIQISMIDTWAATSAGAYALSENSLYTVDAWQTFFDRLEPGGVLSVSRWHKDLQGRPLESYRLVSLAVKSLQERGVENPRQHMLMAASPPSLGASVATLLVSPDPFTAGDVATFETAAKWLGFELVLTPTYASDEKFDAIASAADLDSVISKYPEDLSAPTDNRPYFFQMASLRNLLDGSLFDNTGTMRPALVLFNLSLAVLVLAVACVALPLLVTARRTPASGMVPLYVYFAAIGLGFILLEISQLQRLIIFLGHPTYALTVVLFSLLLASGVGSLLVELVLRPRWRYAAVVPLVALLAAIVGFSIGAPAAISHFESEPTNIRILVAAGLLMPLGLLMGMPFSIGMRIASATPDAPTPFLWGINGAMSVLGSVLGMLIALLWGISAAFWTGGFCYLMAAAALAVAVVPGTAMVGAAEPVAVAGRS